MRRAWIAATMVIVAAGGIGVGPSVARADDVVTVVADHLNNPRQMVAYGNKVFVAEAGTGGDPTTCVADQPCVGFTGSVTAVFHDKAHRVQSGLISLAIPGEGGGPPEVVGVDALAMDGNRLYGIATSSCQLPPGLPSKVTRQLGHILRMNGGRSVTPLADVATFECTQNPDGQEPDSDPYGIAVRRGTFYVADAAGNDVVKVRKGKVSVATVLSTTAQPVPTSLAFGPDGALYIGTLNFEGGPGGAAVYRLAPGSDTATPYAEGLTAVTGIAFDRTGNLYASEFSTTFDSNGPGMDGDVVVIPPGGGTDGRRTLGTGQLHFPGGVAVTDNGTVYVSNWSIAGGEDGAFGPGNHGQVVKIVPG